MTAKHYFQKFAVKTVDSIVLDLVQHNTAVTMGIYTNEGRTTLASVWADDAGTITKTNPVAQNVGGNESFDGYLTPGITYYWRIGSGATATEGEYFAVNQRYTQGLTVGASGSTGELQVLRGAAQPAPYVGNGLYVDAAGSVGLYADQYGNIRGGTNPGVHSAVWNASNNNFTSNVSVLYDFAYNANTRRVHSRHFFATEINNPGNLQLGRVNDHSDLYPYCTTDDTQNGTPDYTHQTGVLATQTLGRFVFRGTVAPFTTLTDTTITGAVNNGSGLIRLTATAHGLTTSNSVRVFGVLGTTEANGYWTVTVINANTVDLQGSAFVNAYVSGGTIGPPRINAAFQQSSVDVYAQAAEDLIQTASGNHFATGGEFYIATRPLGDVSGLGADANPDRFGIDARGILSTFNLTWNKSTFRVASAAGWPARGDLIVGTSLRALSNVVAQQHSTGGANAATTSIGAIGPASEAGVQFGTAPDAQFYLAPAAGGVKALVATTSVRANYLTLLSDGPTINRIRANYLATTDRLRDTATPSWAIDLGDSDLLTLRRAAATAGSPSYTAYLQLSDSIADTETALLLRRNVGGSFTLQRVSMGAADSGGAGFKLLRLPN